MSLSYTVNPNDTASRHIMTLDTTTFDDLSFAFWVTNLNYSKSVNTVEMQSGNRLTTYPQLREPYNFTVNFDITVDGTRFNTDLARRNEFLRLLDSVENIINKNEPIGIIYEPLNRRGVYYLSVLGYTPNIGYYSGIDGVTGSFDCEEYREFNYEVTGGLSEQEQLFNESVTPETTETVNRIKGL